MEQDAVEIGGFMDPNNWLNLVENMREDHQLTMVGHSETKMDKVLARLTSVYSDTFEDANDCPFGQATKNFLSFFKMIIDGLASGHQSSTFIMKHSPMLLSLGDMLQHGYDDVHDLHDDFKSIMLSHPHRRTLVGTTMLACATPSNSIEECYSIIQEAQERYQREAYASDTVLEDPDDSEVFMAGLRPLPVGGIPINERVCCICTENYSSLRIAYRTPCNHMFCGNCLSEWRQKCQESDEKDDDMFSCPLCRQCLVCGAPDCPYHVMNEGGTKPKPVLQILRTETFYGENFNPLLSWEGAKIWHFREWSRPHRELLAWLDQAADEAFEKSHFDRDQVLLKRYDVIMDVLRAQTRQFDDVSGS